MSEQLIYSPNRLTPTRGSAEYKRVLYTINIYRYMNIRLYRALFWKLRTLLCTDFNSVKLILLLTVY